MMTNVRLRGEEIRNYLLQTIGNASYPVTVAELCSTASARFGVTKSAISKHIRELRDLIDFEQSVGRTKTCVLRQLNRIELEYSISGSGCLDEMTVFMHDIDPNLVNMSDNAKDILSFCFTEMFNNVMDHSDASLARVIVANTAISTMIIIADNGIGIFRKVKEALNLPDERQSLLELSKGKFTTDPNNHTGEGIFFSSRACDMFAIASNGLIFSHTQDMAHDILTKVNPSEGNPGTFVLMSVNNNSPRKLRDVFDQYSSVDGGFTSTEVPVKLIQYKNEGLISRSQAKRLLSRVDKFKFVTLDFENISFIGQAFADQIFRVFAREHPDIQVTVKNACPDIIKAIKIAQNNT